MKTVTINPSIAVVVNIESVGYSEAVSVYYTSDVPWTGSFEVTIWDSSQKNTSFSVAEALVVVGDLMTFKIEPKIQNLPSEKYYYEISDTETKRIVFKGILNILK